MHPFFIFVKCDLGKAYDVATALVEEIEGVSEVYSISGPFELLVKVYIEDGQDIGRYVNEKSICCPISRTPRQSLPSTLSPDFLQR